MKHELKLEFYRDNKLKEIKLKGVDDIKIMTGDIKKLITVIKDTGLIEMISGDEIEINDPVKLFGDILDLYEDLLKGVIVKNVNMVSKEKIDNEDLDNTELDEFIQFLIGYATLAAAKYSVALGINFQDA